MDLVRSLDHPLRFVTTPGGWNGDGPGRGGGPTEGEWGQGGVYRLLGFLVWTM